MDVDLTPNAYEWIASIWIFALGRFSFIAPHLSCSVALDTTSSHLCYTKYSWRSQQLPTLGIPCCSESLIRLCILFFLWREVENCFLIITQRFTFKRGAKRRISVVTQPPTLQTYWSHYCRIALSCPELRLPFGNLQPLLIFQSHTQSLSELYVPDLSVGKKKRLSQSCLSESYQLKIYIHKICFLVFLLFGWCSKV